MNGPKRMRRAVEGLVLGRLGRRRRRAAREALRHDADGQAHYDRIVDAMRILEGREVAELELELVQTRLFDDLAPEPQEESARTVRWWRWWGWLSSLAAVACVLALVVILPGRPQFESGFTAKGGLRGTALGLEVLCAPNRAQTLVDLEPLRSASRGPCSLGGTMAFAARLDRRYEGGRMVSLFGVDEYGEVRFYAPTPLDPAGVPLEAGHWEPLPMAVHLDVHHRAGTLHVYALAATEALSISDIEQLAEQIEPMSNESEQPWHRRFEQISPIARLCSVPDACASAELRLELAEDAP